MNQNQFKMKFLQKGEEGAERPSLYIYGDIYQTFDDWLSGEEGNTAKGIQQFLETNNDADSIDVYINSMGGDVFEGTAIANQLRRFGGHVTVTVDGFACSIASVIAMAGDEVRMPKNATMMIHNMWTTMVGNAAELRKMADDLDVLMEANKTIYLDKAGKKLDYNTLTELLDAETWLSVQQNSALSTVWLTPSSTTRSTETARPTRRRLAPSCSVQMTPSRDCSRHAPPSTRWSMRYLTSRRASHWTTWTSKNHRNHATS